ncbi:hypothetical protein [Gemmatimonas sp.]|uniref:hypothetical protein n=1 Tax=Gemmatimonas sp. TaxID=1962908 RepID=UPI0037BFFC1B
MVRNGRSGQKQNGVDIYGRPEHLAKGSDAYIAAAQCKATATLDIDTVRAEVASLEGFKPFPAEFIVLTTASRDATVQTAVRAESWVLRVEVLFWEDISLLISEHTDLLKKHFPGWITETTGVADVLSMVRRSIPTDFAYNDEYGTYVHTSDLKLQIRVERRDVEPQRFNEAWVSRFPNPVGYAERVHIFYDNTLVMTRHFVSVDGGRYLLPYPKSAADLRISAADAHLGGILSEPTSYGYAFADGLNRAGVVIDHSLPGFLDASR